jgi:hypothetical protein
MAAKTGQLLKKTLLHGVSNQYTFIAHDVIDKTQRLNYESIYSFLILYIEFHVVSLQTKFFRSCQHYAEGRACLVYAVGCKTHTRQLNALVRETFRWVQRPDLFWISCGWGLMSLRYLLGNFCHVN